MNKLIKGAAFAVCAGAMLGFTGCGGGGNTPEAVAKAALEAEFKSMGLSSDYQVKVARSEINGDKGVVYLDLYFQGKKDETSQSHYKVINVDGQWKVDPKK